METLAHAGHTEHTVERLIADHRASDPNGWRRRFWEQMLGEANARYADRDAAQPCESDPSRPTEHAADRGHPTPRAA